MARLYMKRNSLLCLLPVLFAVPATGCGNGPDTVALRIGENVLHVEVARTEQEQARGLMFRNEIPEDRGMLFVYDLDRRLSFWMKDTKVPLSIAFIASDGTIREIQEMKPLSLREVVSRQSVRYALEVNQGYFERHGIKIGDTVVFPDDLPH